MSDSRKFDRNHKFENFDEFKQIAQVRKFGYQGFDYDGLSASELKSKAILGDLDKDFNKGDGLYYDLLKALPVILEDETQLYKKMYWSGVAGDLNEADAQDLINVLSDLNDRGYIDSIDYKALIIPFALRNETAWQVYSEELMNDNVPPFFLLKALEYVPEVKEEVLPLLNKKFGEKFTKAYLENKSLIDRTPLKRDFYANVNKDMYRVANFLAFYTWDLKFLSEKYGEDSYDHDCISNALKKEGFREEAYELFVKKLANKSSYADASENAHPNILVKELFPDLVAQLNDVVLKDITKEQIEAASKNCFRRLKLRKDCLQDQDLSHLDSRLIKDIIKENPDNLDQVKKVVSIFYQMNPRPDTYGSDYNQYYPYTLVPLVKKDVPEWMYAPISNAVSQKVISTDRLGSVKNLFDAAKAWKINPKIIKQDAEKIGRMPLNARIVAGAVYDLIVTTPDQDGDTSRSKAEKRNAFWTEMKKAQDMGWRQAISHYCYNNAETKGRILSFYYPELEENVQVALRGNMRIEDVVNLDVEELNHNLELFEKYLGLTKDDIFGHINEQGYLQYVNGPFVKRLAAFGKVFKNEDLKIKFLEQAKKYKGDALSWLPTDMSDEKYESMSKYLSQNLFYNDGTNVEVLRSLENLKDFADVWEKLTPQQEQFNFSKILGISYTEETVDYINKHFIKYKNLVTKASRHGADKKINIPDNLRLYQKLLLSLYNPKTQNRLDELLSLDRKQGLNEIIRHFNQNLTDRDVTKERALLDLTIGNNANIGNFERTLIASSLHYNLSGFKPNMYQEIVDKIVKGLVIDPDAADLFRKHYVEMVSLDVFAKNKDFLKIRESYQNNKNWIIPSAIKATQCLGKNFDRYMKKVSKYNILQNKEYQKRLAKGEENVPQPDLINIHDALYWLPERVQEKDQHLIMALIDKHLFYPDDQGKEKHRPLSEFEVIAQAWCGLTPEERKLGYKELAGVVKSKKYPYAKYNKFASEAARWGVPIDRYESYEKIYEQGLQVPELIDSSKRFACKNLVGRFLPRDDPRIGFFGKWTDCCQHFNGIGRQCAVSSVKDPFSQLFVVEKEDGSIVAGSWVWESKIKRGDKYYKALCYDNIEAIGDYKSSQAVLDVYKSTLPYLAEQNYATVTVGVGYQDANVDEFEYANHPIPMNKNYSGYTDADTQKVMMYNPEATAVDYNEGDIYIAGALAEDIPAMTDVCNDCFPEGDRELQVPDEDPQGLVLKDQGKVVGYVIWSEKEHSIYDMAVLPQYRKDKNGSSFKLLNETVRRIKKIGGEWSAELRDETSLRYMKAMAGRGLVNLEIGDLDHEMSDGSKVYKVKFSAKEAPQHEHNYGRFVPPTNEGR